MTLGSSVFLSNLAANHNMKANRALLLHSLRVVHDPSDPGITIFIKTLSSLRVQLYPLGPPNFFGVSWYEILIVYLDAIESRQ